MHSQSTILQKANNPTGLQNPSAWARPNSARVRSCECQPSINSTNVVWNTFAREFSEGRQSGERINLGLSFASFGQAKEEESYNSHYGFIFTKASHTEEQISRAIAHELGHGAFHLWHTFSTENKYQATQGATNNLMDYTSTSTDLYKYQWDYIHNPESVLFRGDDEEGELKDIDSVQILSYLEKIHKANFDNKKSLVLNIDKDWSYGKSGQIALDDSTELSYLFMFALTSNEEKGNTISDVTTTKAISIIPYERNKTVSTNDGVSYTTYKFKTEQKFECLSFTVKTDECEVFEGYLYGSQLVVKELAQKAVEQAALSMQSNSICNVCTRTALYLIKNDSTLFPYEGSALKESISSPISYIKGYTTNPGRAQHIKEDFDAMKPEYSAVFEEVAKNTSETWQQYFERLQNMANSGEIIIGAMMDSKNETGHVMMITPGDMAETCIDEDSKTYENKYGDSFYKQEITKVPIVIECGQGVRDCKAPLCTNVDRKGAQERLKWYKYKK